MPPASQAGTAVAAVRPRATAAVGAVPPRSAAAVEAVGPWSTSADWPDSLTDPGGAADLATNAVGAAVITSPQHEIAADSQKAADVLTTAERFGPSQVPALDTLVGEQLKPADSSAADQPKTTDDLAAGSAVTSNMLAAGQQTQAADSSAADRPKSADSLTAASPLANDMLVAGQQEPAEDGLAGEQPQAAESLKGDQTQAADLLVAGHMEACRAEKRPPPVILTLCGVPGSGKSTFCAQLIARGHASWVRVNQDSINRGRQVMTS